jgi:DNA-binding transcriptional ArsR family regulator
MASADLLLHPVRLRIVQAFLGDRELTTTQLGELLPEVSTATLYRHVATLLGGGVLDVVEEHKVRGASERTYRLRAPAASVGPDEAAEMSRDEHRQAFTTFVAGLLADFDRYLDRDAIDLGRDRVGYRQAALYATDEEVRELTDELRKALAPWLALPPAADRTRRLLTTILVPGD